MSNQQTQVSSRGGIGFVGVLTIVFIVLKLVGVISWSWWWVLSPLWISFGLSILLLIGVAIVVLIISALTSSAPGLTRSSLHSRTHARAAYRRNLRK